MYFPLVLRVVLILITREISAGETVVIANSLEEAIKTSKVIFVALDRFEDIEEFLSQNDDVLRKVYLKLVMEMNTFEF